MSQSPGRPEILQIVVPVFNDWPSFAILLQELDQVASRLPCRVRVSAIDDGSIDSGPADFTAVHLDFVEVVRLATNVGHQRAIAVGMCLAAQDAVADAVLVMDADGEDSPQAIERLLAAAAASKDFCVVAERRKRSENLKFKLSYLVYKFVFKLVTGREIRFGNFSLTSRNYLRRLVMVPDLWNNLPAALLRSRLPIQRVGVDRAPRYTGTSKMNFTSLIVHGLSGISVYADTIFVRLLLLTVGLVALTILSVAVVLFLRIFFPLHATPGWATTVTFGMVIILTQVLSVTLSSILMLLNGRVQRLVVPLRDFEIYVAAREMLHDHASVPLRDEALSV